MQHILDFTAGDKKYISKPFDFEALCIINDEHIGSEKKGPIRICSGAVDYLFEGTEATQDIINSLEPGIRASMCMKAWEFYAEAISSKKK